MNRCPFCEFDRARLVAESEVAIALRDTFPISEGHTLVLPRRHVRTRMSCGVAGEEI
jgi:ATP adenylyltransferase